MISCVGHAKQRKHVLREYSVFQSLRLFISYHKFHRMNDVHKCTYLKPAVFHAQGLMVKVGGSRESKDVHKLTRDISSSAVVVF